MKSFYIIIRGPLGIGKSTISKELAKKINAKIFHIDKILEEIKLDKVDKKLRGIPLENFLKVNKNIIPEIKKILDKGEVAIIDGCFYYEEQLENIKHRLENYDGFFFTLTAPLDTCIKRDSKRKLTYGEKAAKEVYDLVSKFDYGTAINTENKTEKQVLEELLKKII